MIKWQNASEAQRFNNTSMEQSLLPRTSAEIAIQVKLTVILFTHIKIDTNKR